MQTAPSTMQQRAKDLHASARELVEALRSAEDPMAELRSIAGYIRDAMGELEVVPGILIESRPNSFHAISLSDAETAHRDVRDAWRTVALGSSCHGVF